MISLSGVVWLVVYLLVAACIFGLLHWLIHYVGSQFPESAPFVKVAHIVLVVVAVLVLIGILLHAAGGPVPAPVIVR